MDDRLRSLRDSADFAEERLVASVQSLLIEILNEKGLSKSDLAKRMGVSRARVSQIFSDDQNFTFRLVAKAFHALGEELYLARRGGAVEYKSIDAAQACADLSFDDVTRELSHGFEWLDGPIRIGGQRLSKNVIFEEQISAAIRGAVDAALKKSGETRSTRQSRLRDSEEATVMHWSQEGDGCNVIPMARKRVAGNG